MPQTFPSLSGLTKANQLASAKMLAESPSDVNLTGLFTGPEEGHVPTAWEQYSGDRVADQAEEALGAGPAIDAFRKMARAQQMQDIEDRGMEEADFFAHGLDRGMTHANVQNQVQDTLSEGAYRRRTLPYAAQGIAEDEAQARDLAAARYSLPAQIKAQGDLAAAAASAQGRIGAAQAAHPVLDPVEALRQSILKRFEAGYGVSPDDIKQLQTILASQQPPQ